MKLTPEQLRQNAAAMLAFADGKPVQMCCDDGKWSDYGDDYPSWDCSTFQYRPKPEPVTRPWQGAADVPSGPVWVRSKLGSHGCEGATGADSMHAMIVTVSVKAFTYASQELSHVKWDEAHKIAVLEWSTDRKNWHPCQITEPTP